MGRINKKQWGRYKSIIDKNAHDMFNQETITWVRQTHNLQRYGEDDESYNETEEIELKCLSSYNYFRTWPMTDENIAGKLDKESQMILLNITYLKEQGYLTPEGMFDFDPGNDYFIFRGQKVTASGETPISQAHDRPLFIMLILKREPTSTGSEKY